MKFEINREGGKLGSGVYADVWSGTDELGREIAVKVFDPEDVGTRAALDHAFALARVNHPNVIRVHSIEDFSDPDSGDLRQALLMELAEGPTLSERLATNWDEVEARMFADALLSGLKAIHSAGLAHGDLHDENVLVGTQPKIIDILYLSTLAFLCTEGREQRWRKDLRAAVTMLSSIIERTAQINPTTAERFRRLEIRNDLTFELIESELAQILPKQPSTEALNSTRASIRTQSASSAARTAIEQARPNADVLVERASLAVVHAIDELIPPVGNRNFTFETLADAIQSTLPECLRAVEIASLASEYNSTTCMERFNAMFSSLHARFDTPPGFSGSFRDSDFDLHRFVAHEVYASFVAVALSQRRWEVLKTILNYRDIVPVHRHRFHQQLITGEDLHQTMHLLQRTQGNRTSPLCDLVQARHTSGPLAELVPMDIYASGDLLIALKFNGWRLSSWVWMASHTPRLLTQMALKDYAMHISDVLKVPGDSPSVRLASLRSHIGERLGVISGIYGGRLMMFPLFSGFDPEQIGTID